MTETPETLALNAAEAEQLRTNPAFQRAVMQIRKDALETLAGMDPTDIEAIRTNQARIRAIDNLCGEIGAAIIRGAKPRTVTVA